jgi:hypothetical protein
MPISHGLSELQIFASAQSAKQTPVVGQETAAVAKSNVAAAPDTGSRSVMVAGLPVLSTVMSTKNVVGWESRSSA